MKVGLFIFDPRQISSITGYHEQKSNYVFYPKRESKKIYICKWLNEVYPLGAIPWGKTKELPDRWSTYGENDEDYYRNNATIKNENLRIDEKKKIAYYKAYIYINFKNGDSKSIYFDNEDEFLQFIKRTIEMQKFPLIVINFPNENSTN